MRVWYNPDLVSRNFIVPGLIAVILMIIVAILSSLTIAREWENGTMEQLLSTPVRPAEMALGKLSAYFVLGIVDMLICLFVGVFIFDVPFKGNLVTADGFELRISVRRAGLRHFDFRRESHPVDGVSDGLADVVPAGVSAFRIHLSHREYAADHSSDRAVCAGAILHQHPERAVFERRGILADLVRFLAAGGIRSADVFLRDAQAAREGGVIMRQRLRCIIRKEFRQLLRDPRMRAMLFMPPLIQLLIFGYAANLDVNTAHIAWMDQDHSSASRELLSQFQGSGRFQIVAEPDSDAQMQKLLDRATVDAVVRVMPGFARDVERGRATSVQVLLDGTNSNTASIVSNYAAQTIARYSERGDGAVAAVKDGRRHHGVRRRRASRECRRSPRAAGCGSIPI